MVNAPVRKVDALLFDKDGTLFDFHATWSAWAARLIAGLAGGSDAKTRELAEAMAFDLASGRFRPESPVIAGTNREAAQCLAPALPGRSLGEIEELLSAESARAPLSPAVPLAPLLEGFLADGLHLGVVTNDSEFAAVAQLRAAGVHDHFHFIAGFDSGHGAKPGPGALLAFAEARGLAPARVAMVGDSTHDLFAGRAAGMMTVAVLTGVAEAGELAPHADVVLDHIGHLPAWLVG
ncbi:MAG: HAD family hydrolase [Roseovarius sp.]